MYLGDGCISECPRGVYRLRITLDAIYPDIAAECAAAMEAVVPGKRSHLLWRRDQRSVEVSSYSKHWTCLIPQHGSGRKHMRRIVLTDWQSRLVASHLEPFIRGLIQSDGTRIVATERKGNNLRRAARYAFRNRSEDILRIFADACAGAGVHCTRSSETQIAVYSKAAVARLDEFVGPKSCGVMRREFDRCLFSPERGMPCRLTFRRIEVARGCRRTSLSDRPAQS